VAFVGLWCLFDFSTFFCSVTNLNMIFLLIFFVTFFDFFIIIIIIIIIIGCTPPPPEYKELINHLH